MRNDIILQKMLRYTMKLVEYCSGYTYDTFISDIKLVEACVFNLRAYPQIASDGQEGSFSKQ